MKSTNLVLDELINNRLALKNFVPEVSKQLLKLACCEVKFNNQLYKQIDAISMGFPLGEFFFNILVGLNVETTTR